MFVFWRYKPMELERESPGRECLQTWCECQHRVADCGIRICCWNRGADWLSLLQFSALPFLLAPFLLCLLGTTRGTPPQKPKHPQKREHELWTPKERIAETRGKEESRHQLQNFQTSSHFPNPSSYPISYPILQKPTAKHSEAGERCRERGITIHKTLKTGSNCTK
jgi:hypothetical protein